MVRATARRVNVRHHDCGLGSPLPGRVPDGVLAATWCRHWGWSHPARSDGDDLGRATIRRGRGHRLADARRTANR